MMPLWSKAIVFMLAVLFGIMAGVQVYQLTYFIRTPLEITKTVVENPEVRFGDFLRVRHIYMRHAYCKVDIDRFIVRLPDLTLVRRERLPAGTGLLGASDRVILIPTKFPSQVVVPFWIADVGVQDLFPGTEYLLREFVHSDCGDRLHTAIAPDAWFRVIE